MEENLHSIFRIVKNYDVEELRKAVIEKNMHSIFRLVNDEDLRKFLLEDKCTNCGLYFIGLQTHNL